VKVPDANVLLHAVNTSAVQREPARQWLERALSGSEAIGFAWSAILAFVRVSSHPSLFPSPLPVSDAVATVQDWLAQPPAVIVTPGPRHLELLGGLLADTGTGGNLVPDAHLAALALENRATIVSFDRDFGRFAGVRLEVPLIA
jgi:toxin-antitoxin system PIN domain toxin